MRKVFSKSRTRMSMFSSDERGVALTEYAMLLGLFSGVTILAVLAFGDSLGDIWQSYAGFLSVFSPGEG